MVWGSIIAWYLFLAGLGGGAFMTASLVEKLAPNSKHVVKIGHIIAPVVVVIGLVLLMFDAEGGFHNPLRFLFLLNNFGSVMTWGVVILGLFVVSAIIVLVYDFILKGAAPKWVIWAGNIFGFGTAAYTGCLLGVVHTFPLWNNAMLPVLFVVSAISTGMAAVVLVASIKYPEEMAQVPHISVIHAVFPALELLLFFFLLLITNSMSVAGSQTVASLLTGAYAVHFWLGIIVIGLAGPLAIELSQIKSGKHNRGASIAADAGVLIGGFLVRYVVLVAALPLVLL